MKIDESNPIICSSVGVLKVWLIVASWWELAAYSLFEFQVPVTLVIDTFKLSLSGQISLSECTFSQKDFTHVAQVQISPDVAARPILALIYQFLVHQFLAPKSRTKSESANKAQKGLA